MVVSKIKSGIKNVLVVIMGFFMLGIFYIAAVIVNKICCIKLKKLAQSYKIDADCRENDSRVRVYKKNITDYEFRIIDKSDFKIMQISDIHIGGGFASYKKDKCALEAVATMVKKENPDLVIVTGDISYPVFFLSGTLNNLRSMEVFATLMNGLGVYWTFVFGNHDTESYSPYTRADICDWYKKKIEKDESFSRCIFYNNEFDNVEGYGNQFITLADRNDAVIQNLILFDSHSYTKSNPFGLLFAYDHIKRSQELWAGAKVNVSKSQNRDVMAKSLVFLHIPLTEYRDAWRSYCQNGNTEKTQLISGEVCENQDALCRKKQKTWGIFSPVQRSGLIDELNKEEQTLQGVFCGHDHKNNFSIMHNGVMLNYTKTIDYLAYFGISKMQQYRGCRIINVKNDGSFETYCESYSDEKYKHM